jgi:hypothetical protein
MPSPIRFTRPDAHMATRPESLRALVVLASVRGLGLGSGNRVQAGRGIDGDGGGWKAL